MHVLVLGNRHSKYIVYEAQDSSFDDVKFYRTGKLEVLPPVFRKQSGRVLSDVSLSSGFSFIVSEKFKTHFELNKLTGLSFSEIKVVEEKKSRKSKKFFLIRPTNFGLPIDFSIAKSINQNNLTLKTGIGIVPPTEKVDIFSPEGSQLLIINDRMFKVLTEENIELSGIEFADLNQIIHKES